MNSERWNVDENLLVKLFFWKIDARKSIYDKNMSVKVLSEKVFGIKTCW